MTTAQASIFFSLLPIRCVISMMFHLCDYHFFTLCFSFDFLRLRQCDENATSLRSDSYCSPGTPCGVNIEMTSETAIAKKGNCTHTYVRVQAHIHDAAVAIAQGTRQPLCQRYALFSDDTTLLWMHNARLPTAIREYNKIQKTATADERLYDGAQQTHTHTHMDARVQVASISQC